MYGKKKKEKKERKKEEEKKKVGDNNGQATHGARKHASRLGQKARGYPKCGRAFRT